MWSKYSIILTNPFIFLIILWQSLNNQNEPKNIQVNKLLLMRYFTEFVVKGSAIKTFTLSFLW